MALGIFLTLLANSNGLYEADAIVPEDYDIEVPNERSYPSDGEDTDVFKADTDLIEIDASYSGTC